MKFLGIKAGAELGLCTFDDWDWLQIADPGITAVALSTGEIGASGKASARQDKRQRSRDPRRGNSSVFYYYKRIHHRRRGEKIKK